MVLKFVKVDGKEVKVDKLFLRFIETFDNTTLMAGHRSGVQKCIREVNPELCVVIRCIRRVVLLFMFSAIAHISHANVARRYKT